MNNLKEELFNHMMLHVSNCTDSFEDTTILNFNYLYNSAIGYADSVMELELDTVTEEEFIDNCELIDTSLMEIFKALEAKFEIELTVDDYNEFRKVYEFFVGRRIYTIADAILYMISTNHIDNLPRDTGAEEDWVILKKNLLEHTNLKDILDTYYMEKCIPMHSLITFNNAGQDFYSCFSQHENRENEFMSLLESDKLKSIIVHNLTLMKINKIIGGNGNEKD